MSQIKSVFQEDPFRQPSSTIRNILFPTDFSSAAHCAFIYALHMAEQLNAEIQMMYVHDSTPQIGEGLIPDGFIRALKVKQEAEAMEHFNVYLSEALEEVDKKIGIIPSVVYGKTVPAIVDMSKREDIDLIIMGTQGAASISERILGSVTVQVLQQAHCPVLAIPAEASYQPIQEILYAMSMDEVDLQSIDHLLTLAEALGAKVSCIHVTPDKKEWSELNADMYERLIELKQEGLIQLYISHDHDIPKGLRRFITENRLDMLSMTARHKHIFNRLMDDSLTHEMVLYTDLPILTFHASK